MKKLKDVKTNPAPSAKPLGVNPSDPWSAKAGITEGALDQYLMSKGINPNFISTQMKISHAKSTAFLKWKQNHVESVETPEEVENIDEAGRCWTGYKPVPGKKPFSPGSCKKEEKGSQTTELTPEEVEMDEMTSMSMGGLRHAVSFNKGDTAHHSLAGHVTVGHTDKRTGLTHVTGLKDKKTYQVRMHTLRQHPIGEDADPVKKVKTTALDKFRAGSAERAKKHADIQSKQSKDGSGMSSAIDRLAKHIGEEMELVEETLKSTNYKGINVDSQRVKPSKSLRAQHTHHGKDYHIFKGTLKKARGNDKNFVVHKDGQTEIEFKYPDHTADEKEAILHHLRTNKKLKEEVSQAAVNKFHAKLDKLVHKTFGKRRAEMGMKEESELDEMSKANPRHPMHQSDSSLYKKTTKGIAKNYATHAGKFFSNKDTMDFTLDYKKTDKEAPRYKNEEVELNEDNLESIAKKHGMEFKRATYGAGMKHPTKGEVSINRYGEWHHYPAGSRHSKAHGDSSFNFKDLDKHLSSLKEDVGDAKAATNADGAPNASLQPVSEKRKQMTKSARMIKSLYKKKGMVKEDMFDHEKEDKSVATYGKKPKMSTTSKMDNLGENKPEAAAVLSGGTTLTGQKRDTLEIDPAMRNRPGQPDIPNKDTKK